MRTFTEQGHASDDCLVLHVLEDLSPSQRERVGEHLRSCPDCRGRLQQTSDFLALFRALAQAQAGRSAFNCSVGAIRMRPRTAEQSHA